MLRPFEASARLGLACLVAVLVCVPTALAVAGDPKPDPEKLWEEFPLNPTGERLDTTQQPERQQPGTFQPPAGPTSPATTQAADETSTPASDGSALLFVLIAGAGALVVLAAVGLVSVRLRHAGHQPEPTLPLRQWASQSNAGQGVVQGREPLAGGPASLDAGGGFGAVRHSPAGADRLRRLDPRPSLRGFRRRHRDVQPKLSGSRPSRVFARVRKALWTEDTIPLYVGSAAAIVFAIFIVHWVG